MRQFKFLEHTADIKFQAFGKNIGEVFENSALAMTNAICSDSVKEKIKKKIKVQGNDQESLLYNFLEEILFLFDTEQFLVAKIKNLKIKDNELSAELIGDSAENHEIKIDIKAITYNDMFVKKQDNKWVTQVVVDV